MTGLVYFIQCRDRVKIGFSGDPVRRLAKVASDAPYPCSLLGSVDGDVFTEASVHSRFAAHRVHGEWFTLVAEIVEFVEVNQVSRPLGVDRFERADLTGASALRRWRYQSKFTAETAAEMAATTRTTWGRWENGSVAIPPSRVVELEGLTGIPREQLRPDLYPSQERVA